MTRSEFYSNLQFYNSRKPVDILSHAFVTTKEANAAKTKNGDEWGQSYYKKEDIGGGKYRYFYTKEEYDAYINNKSPQSSSADNAKGAGAEYQKYLDAQKQQKQQQQYNNSKNGAEQAAADRAAREKANAQAAQEEATKQKMLNIVDDYNKSTGSKSGADEFNKAVKKLGLETEAGVQKYGGYEAAVKAVEEEMKKSANNYNKNAQAAQNAGADRANKTIENNKKAIEAENAERSKKNDQGRDAAIKNSSSGTVKSNADNISEQKRKEEEQRKDKQETENNKYYNESDLSKKNDSGRDAAIKNSGSSNYEVRHDKEMLEQARKENNEGTRRAKEEEARKKAQAEQEEIEAARERNRAENKANAERSKANDQGRDAAIKNSNQNQTSTSNSESEKRAKEEAERKARQQNQNEHETQPDRDAAIRNSGSSNKNTRIIEEATSKNADVKKIAEENGVSEDYVKELTYNTTGKSVNNNSNNYKPTERTKENTQIVDDEFAKAMGWDTGKTKETKSSNNQTVTERNEKIIDEGMNKNADPKALASKYGVSEEYIRELLYNSTGKIFHTAMNPRYKFYSNLQTYNENNELYHHGIIGQKWGVRRYQNPDGSLTEEGRRRYLNPDGTLSDKAPNKIKRAYERYERNEWRKRYDSGELLQDDAVFNKEIQKQKLDEAKKTDSYDLTFLEVVQNAYENDGWDNHIDELLGEYEKYLKNPYKYMEEFDSAKWNRDHNDGKLNKSK